MRCGSGLAFLIRVELNRTFQKLLSCGNIFESHGFCLFLNIVDVNNKVSQSFPDCYYVMLCQLLMYSRTKRYSFLYLLSRVKYNVHKFQHDNPSHPHAPSNSLTLLWTLSLDIWFLDEPSAFILDRSHD